MSTGPPPRKKSRFFAEGKSKIGAIFAKSSDRTKQESTTPATSFSDAASSITGSSFNSNTSGGTQATSFQSTVTSFGAYRNDNNHNSDRPAQNVSFNTVRPESSACNSRSNRVSAAESALSNLSVRDTRRDGVYGPSGLQRGARSFPDSGRPPQSYGPPSPSFGNNTFGETPFQPTASPSTRQGHQRPALPEQPPFEVYRLLHRDYKAAVVDAARTGRSIGSYFQRFPVPGEPFDSEEAAKFALGYCKASPEYTYHLLSATQGQQQLPLSSYPPLAYGYQTHPAHGQLSLPRTYKMPRLQQSQTLQEEVARQDTELLGNVSGLYTLPPSDTPDQENPNNDPVKRQTFQYCPRPTADLECDANGSPVQRRSLGPIPNLNNCGITNLPLHATLTPNRRPTADPTLYMSPGRISRALAIASSSRKRKRVEPVLPPPAYTWTRSNDPNFNVFSGILLFPEICFHLAAQLTVNDLVSLYAISRDFHTIIDTRFTTVVLSQSLTKAPESSRTFHFRSYRYLCRPDPAARIPNPDPIQAAQNKPRMVPSFRWLKMIMHREKVVHEILAIFAEDGVPLPSRCRLALKRMWYMMDIPDNARRIGFVHNRSLFTDLDLYFAMCFFVKLDMRLNDPVSVECRHGVRKMLLSQRSMTTVLRVLKREVWRRQIDVMRAWIRYRYEPLEDELGLPIFGIPADQVGKGRYEYWGLYSEEKLKRPLQSLLRPEQLVMREAIRRGLRFHKHFLRSMLYGYVRMDTLEDYEPRTIGRRIEGLEDEYGIDDEIGGAEVPFSGGKGLLDLGERREVSLLCVKAPEVYITDIERREREEKWLELCMEWSRAEREHLMDLDDERTEPG